MSSKSNLKTSAKSSKNSASSVSTTNSKSDTKSKKKVTLEDDDDGDENEGALAYKVLSADQCKSLIALEIEQLQREVCEIFKLNNYSTDLTDASILDYYTGALWWGKEKGFTIQQLSGFFTVVHTLMENVKEQHMPMVENLKEFKKMLIGIEPEYPDVRSAGLDFFDAKQAKDISKYIYTYFFQHYKLYEFMFSHSQAEEIIGTDLEIEVAKAANVPFPPPLDEGAEEDLYNSYIATPPPTPASKSRSRSARSKSSRGSSKEDEEEKVEEPSINIEESDVFSQLTPEDVREVIESVAKDMLGGLQNDMAAKLREKETAIISRINKIHKVAEDEDK